MVIFFIKCKNIPKTLHLFYTIRLYNANVSFYYNYFYKSTIFTKFTLYN